MTTDPLSPNIRYVSQVDGQDADAAALAPLAFAGYAHFTALQIRDGRARAWTCIWPGCGQARRRCMGKRCPTKKCRRACARRSRPGRRTCR